MAVVKRYNTNTSQWEYIIVGEKGDQGNPGVDGVDGDISAVQSTGTEVAFDVYRVYGTDAVPITGNLTETNVGAKLGVTVGIIHNSGTAPTVPATWKRLASSFNYVVSVNNYFIVQHFSDTVKFYSIVQKDADAEAITVSDADVTLDATPAPASMTTLADLITKVAHRHASSEGSGPMPIRVMSQTAYDALSPKDSNTIYMTYD